ncbi:hypothetical protein E2P81_ATG11772 [Venturia nashicola]|nr:hypothetical protein E2P81_ATG11772 [Venturia nashicola]
MEHFNSIKNQLGSPSNGCSLQRSIFGCDCTASSSTWTSCLVTSPHPSSELTTELAKVSEPWFWLFFDYHAMPALAFTSISASLFGLASTTTISPPP